MSAIRWTVRDRSTGEVVTLENPAGREFVKDGVRKVLPPKKEATDGLRLALKHHSRLGMRGGVLA